MALKTSKDTTSYTKWTHVENGKVMVRRIHRIEVQARNGTLYTLRDDKLPDFIQTSAGEGFKGEHLAQILLNPETIKRRTPFTAPVANPFPSLRDLGCAALGFVGFLLLRFLISVATGCL